MPSAPLQLTSHSCEEVVIPKRLRQKSHLRRYQPHVHQLSREAAHEDDGQSGVEARKGGGELPAIHYGHPQVGQYQADLLVGTMGEELESACAIRSFEHGITFILKHASYDAS